MKSADVSEDTIYFVSRQTEPIVMSGIQKCRSVSRNRLAFLDVLDMLLCLEEILVWVKGGIAAVLCTTEYTLGRNFCRTPVLLGAHYYHFLKALSLSYEILGAGMIKTTAATQTKFVLNPRRIQNPSTSEPIVTSGIQKCRSVSGTPLICY